MSASPFRSTAHVYDLLYASAGKDYEQEADEIDSLLQERCPGARSVLDVACGTGAHLRHLSRHYEVAGVDIDPSMLELAERRLPGVALTQGDMRSFRLDRRFDAVVCLFSSVGYLRSAGELGRAIATMAEHLRPGGVLVVDGWVRPDAWREPATVQALAGADGERAAARVSTSHRQGNRTTLEMHYLVGTPGQVDHLVEHHELTLFDDVEYRSAVEGAGLTVDVVASPMLHRDRYLGIAPN